MKITEVFALTGEVIERDATKAEVEQRKKDESQFAIIDAERQAEAEEKAAAKTAAQAKLAALGLTVEDLQALGL